MTLDDDRAPIQPQPIDLPWPPVPSSVEVSASDAELALAEWDRTMGDDYAGMLDATVQEG